MRKTTCLWLKGLSTLEPTNIVEPEVYYYKAANGTIKSDSKWRDKFSKKDRAKERAKTFSGVAKAMADTWG